MCVPIADKTMLGWLRSQLRVLEAWQAELLRRGESDLEAIERLDKHHTWLCAEIERLEIEDKMVA